MKEHSMQDDVAELNRLREIYPNVVFQGRSQRIPTLHEATEEAGHKILAVVQFWYLEKDDTVKARVIVPRRGRYVGIFEVEKQLNDSVVWRRKQTEDSARRYCQDLVLMMSGRFKCAGSKYLDVKIPAQKELKAWGGWLKFIEYDGKEVKHRRWSNKQREVLHASGKYAWNILFDRIGNKAKAFYACEGSGSPFTSQWFKLEEPEDLHRMLLLLDRHADEQGWRSKEMQAGWGVVTQREADENIMPMVKVPKVKQHPTAQASDTQPRIEITRVKDDNDVNLDDFIDPNTPPGWNGNLGQRYVD